jgi:hypothetical protein
MSKSLLKYIKGSPLFQSKYISDNYRRLSDGELRKQLESYREYCLNTGVAEAGKLARGRRDLSIFVEGSAALPTPAVLRQCALYVEDVVVDDPVFALTTPSGDQEQAYNKLLGLGRTNELNRDRLVRAVTYVKNLEHAIRAGFVQFLPITYLHEPPERIPLTYSENGFADVLPAELLAWFRDNAHVFPLQKRDDAWYTTEKGRLVPGRAIGIRFGDQLDGPAIYFMIRSYLDVVDKELGIVRSTEWLPAEPPELDAFNAWVFQSINQSARRLFNRVSTEIALASDVGATYLTRSSFVADLLQKEVIRPRAGDLKTEVFNSVLQLELPLLENVSLERILDVRLKDGQVFTNFRIELEKQLRKLRQTKEPEALAVGLQEVEHELCEVQINEIDKKFAKLRRGLFRDVVIGAAGLAVNFQTAGLAGIPTLLYLAKELKTHQQALSEPRDNPAFFLWQLRKR